MMFPRLLTCLFSLLFIGSHFDSAHAIFSFRGPHRFSAGPEIYFMQRSTKAGSKQHGFLFGGYASYDRIRRSALYWGVEGRYAYGLLKGHTSDSAPLKSHKMDSQIEGRLGYTLVKGPNRCLWVTPYLGGGYFNGTNSFVNPSPMEYKMRVYFPYIALGFLSKIEIGRRFSVGLDFKAKYSVGARSKITGDDDPDVDHAKFYVEDEFMYELDLPFTSNWCWCGKNFAVSFVPFYNFRHYGGHENYPFDFIDTKYQIYGLRFLLRCSF